jgi:hypothetical protein
VSGAAGHLRVVEVDENGEPQTPCEYCATHTEHPACDELQAAKNLAVAIQRKYENLLRDKHAERLNSSQRKKIEELHEFWESHNPSKRKRKLTDDRHDAWEKLLRDHGDEDEDTIRWAIVGACKFPYYDKRLIGQRTSVAPHKGAPKYLEPEHIGEKAGRFEMLASLGYSWLKENDQL